MGDYNRSEAMRRRWQDPEFRARHSAAIKAQWADPESSYRGTAYTERQSAAQRAAHSSGEVRERHRVAQQRAWSDRERREAASVRMSARWEDDAYRERQRASRAALWADPDYRDRMSTSRRQPIRHGTHLGYLQHRRRGEEACGPCKTANNERTRMRKLEDVASVLEFLGLPADVRCMNTACETPEDPPHIDHVHPLSRGGADSHHNKQVLCRGCNLAKGASRDPAWDCRPVTTGTNTADV